MAHFVRDLNAIAARCLRRRFSFMRVMTRASHCVARLCVYGERASSNKYVAREIRRVHKLWVQRLHTLCAHNLWLPLRDAVVGELAIEPASIIFIFRRMVYCRPAFALVRARRNTQGELIRYKPCKKFNFCPHCFAAVVAAQYRVFKGAINSWRKKNSEPLYVTAHIVEQYVPATDFELIKFNPPERLQGFITQLSALLDDYQRHLLRQRRSRQWRCVGSMWRLVVLPELSGWRVQLRQLVLSVENCPPRFKYPKNARVVYHSRVAVTGCVPWAAQRGADIEKDVAEMFTRVATYPYNLLTADPELVAVQLHATMDRRMMDGAGVLRKSGDRRIREFAAASKSKKEDCA